MTIEFVVVTCIAILFGVWVGFYAAKPRSLKGKHVMVNNFHVARNCSLTF
jgi:hypothetical protein